VLDRAALRALISGASGAPAGTESTASLAGGKPSTSTAGASNAANTSTGGVPSVSAPGAVDAKARGAKPTARERAAARGKRGAAPAPTSPESTTATTEAPSATPGAPASASPAAPGTEAPSSTAPGASGSSPLNVASANPASPAGASPGSVSTMAAAIVATSPMIDDFEGGRDASTVGGAWSAAGESNTTSTTVVMGRVVRGARDHALNVTARMGEARDSQARVTVRVAQDGRPLDVSRFHGLRFDARGQGRYRILFVSRGVADGRYHESNFSGSPLWTPVNIPFASVGQTGKGERTPWTGRDLVEIVFLFARDPGDFGYLELDNIRFY
jgi:hypothetical protein